MDFEATIEEEVANTSMGAPHVVLLGAGASRAACPDGDKNGKMLPLMSDFSDVVGLNDLFKKWNLNPDDNFEELFSDLYEAGETKKIETLQTKIESYFNSLELPSVPTIYDHLVLSLRDKDIIATFNWDPFLIQACLRNRQAGLSFPKLLFLHGNVGIGYCLKDKTLGLNGKLCPECKKEFSPTPLLYPIKKKDYAENSFIFHQWELLKLGFENAFTITIFGYSGPKTDQEAIKLMSQAWGNKEERALEQTAFITIENKRKVTNNWKQFIHTHHYEICEDFYESWIARHPRRTVEAYWIALFENKFIGNNPIPRDLTFPKLWEWYRQFSKAEKNNSH